MFGSRLAATRHKPATTGDGADGWNYDAFLSYSHAADGRLAPAVQRCLHRLAKPWYRLRALRVFRDQTSLAANPNLWTTITTALRRSRYFILMASPQAAASPWVRREVEYWKAHCEPETFLITLTDGAIVWDDAAGDFDWERTTALPAELRGWFRAEPLWVDLIWARSQTQLSVRHNKFRDVVAMLAATIHGIAKDDLDSADVRQHRLAARLRWGAVMGLASLTVTSLVLGFVADQQRDEAVTQARVAKSRELAARSEILAAADPATAKQLSVAAWRIAPTPEAHSSMLSVATQPGLGRLIGDAEDVRSVVFSPDGKTVATTSGQPHGTGQTVRLWEPSTGRTTREPLAADVSSAVLSGDGRTLATGGADGAVRFWDIATGKQVGTPLVDQTGGIVPLVLNADGSTLATGGPDRAVRFWDVATRKQVGTPLADQAGRDSALALSPDGRTLAGGGLDGKVELWEVATGQRSVTTLLGHTGLVYSASFSPDGRMLATSAWDGMRSPNPANTWSGTARLWDVSTGRQLGSVLAHPAPVSSVTFSPNGRTVATGGQDGVVRLWDVTTHEQLGDTLTGHTSAVLSMGFSHDGHTLATGARDGTRLWDVTTHRQSAGALDHGASLVSSMAFSQNGRILITGSDADAAVRLWDVFTRRQLDPPGHLPAPAPSPESPRTGSEVVLTPDGRTAVIRDKEGTPWLWDLSTGGRRAKLLGPDVRLPANSGIALSSDGRTAVVNGDDAQLHLWDVTTHRKRGDLPIAGIESVTFSRDGRLVTAGSPTGGEVQLWDARTGRQIGTPLIGHNAPVSAVAFSPDGRILATGSSSDGTVRMWDVVTHRQLGDPIDLTRIVSAASSVSSIGFSPDGRTLAIGGFDGKVALWDVSTGRQIGNAITGHTAAVLSVMFSPDGRTLATGSADHTVRLWDIAYTVDVVSSLCSRVGRSLTPAEWARYVPDQPYQQTCLPPS